MSDAERWRDFRHAAAEALDAAGIDGASRVVMNLPMPPAPPTDDGGAAFERAIAAVASAAYDAGFEAATSGASPSALTGRTAVDELRALHAATLARAEAAERALSTIALQVADYSDDLDDFYDRVSAVVAHLWPLPEDAAPTTSGDDAGGEAMSAWIAVSEDHPDPGQYGTEVIVYTTDGKVMAMSWRANLHAKTERGRAPRWEWRSQISPWAVSHWMPLPEPPAIATTPALVNGGPPRDSLDDGR